MLKIERQNTIMMEIGKQGFVLVPALSELFKCSEETIRRDLKEMEEKNQLVRTHGGAYLPEKFDKSFPTNLRKEFFHSTKSRLARQAMTHIRDHDMIILDSSTTCLSLAEAIMESQKTVTIITNSMLICGLCNESNTNINLICLGGVFRRRTLSFTEQHTINVLKSYHADKAFISCPKLTLEFGLSDNHISEALIRENMLKQAHESFVIADHTKFDISANVLFEGIKNVNAIITDQPLDESWVDYAKQHHIKIEYCPE